MENISHHPAFPSEHWMSTRTKLCEFLKRGDKDISRNSPVMCSISFEGENRQGGLVAEVFKSKKMSGHMIIELENLHARVPAFI